MNTSPAPLLHNRWFGKALASVMALIWAPPEPLWVAAWLGVALIIGHGIDVLGDRLAHPAALGRLFRPLRAETPATEPYLQYLFAGMGHVSKLSGVVSDSHITYVEQLMHRLDLRGARRDQAIDWFTAGKAADYNFAAIVLPEHPIRGTLTELITECLATCASIAPTPAANACVTELVGNAGGDPASLTRAFARASAAAGKVKPKTDELDEARQLLNVAGDADAGTIKKAYRRLVSQCHPDKLPPDTPEHERQAAERATQRLRTAYERVLDAAGPDVPL